jgi:hypothetical protein
MAMMWRTRQLNIPVQQAVCLLRRQVQQAVPGMQFAGSAHLLHPDAALIAGL